MHKPVYKQITDSSVRGYLRDLNDKTIVSSEDADFCINKCPHSEKPCNGTCREYQNFKKEQNICQTKTMKQN